MKWIKRLLVLLAGLLLGSVLILAGAVLFLGESNYKRLLGWGAEQFLDSQLLIEGPFEVDISRNLSLSSADILLKANDDSYRLSIGKLHVNFRLGSYLQTRTFWFNNLELEDIHLEVKETVEDNDFRFEDLNLPPVIVEQADFNNLVFAYQELPPGTLHTFSLDDLKIEELGEHQPLSLRAKGLFEGQPFVLEGMSDSVAQIFERQTPLTVQLELSSEPINAKLHGKIADPLNGRGLDVQIQTDVPNVSDIIEIVKDEIPQLGSLQGSLTMQGDFNAPRLQDINLHLQRSHELELTVEGSIADVLDRAGVDLVFDGKTSNPKVLSWLLFEKYDRMQTIQVRGRLRGDGTQFSLHDVNALAETIDEVKLQVNGNAKVHPQGYRPTPADAGLAVQFSAPTFAAANVFEIEKLPELGAISGSLALALTMDAMGIYEVDCSVGSQKDSQILLKGDVGYVQFTQDLLADLSGLKLQTEIKTAALARLGQQFGFALPALGPGHLRGELITQGAELLLQGATLAIGTQAQSMLNATGLLAMQLRDPAKFRVAMDVNFQATELARLGQQLDYQLPALGPVHLRGKLVTQSSELQLQSAKLIIGTEGHSTLYATGLLATKLSDPADYRVAMDVDIQATELARLAEPFGYTLPELGQTHITGWLESKKSELLFSDVTLVVGAAESPSIRANGTVTTHLPEGVSSIDTKYDLSVSNLVAAYSDMQPRSLGQLQGAAVISDHDGDWGIESFNLSSTQTNLYQLQLSGTYDDLENYDKAHINSSLVIDSPVKLGEALGLDLSGLESFHQQGLLTLNQGRLQFDGKSSLGRTNSQAKISGYLKDGKPVLDGSIEIPVLHLADFGLGSSHQDVPEPHSEKSASPYVFSREEIDIGFLNDVDFDLAVNIDEVESDKLRIDYITGQLKLHNGHLSGPLRLVFEGGNTDINLDIKALDVPEYRLSITADDVTLGPLLAQVVDEVPIQGYSNIHLDLRARGKTPHAMASSLSGNVDLGLENARIPKKLLEMLSVDLLGWAISKSVAKSSHANLNCIMMTFVAEKGEVTSETIIADGPQLSVGGQIDMNLGEETLDIVLIPKEKKRFFSSSTPVKVTGPMKDPQVKAIPLKAAMQQVGAMTLMSSVFIPLRIGEKLWSLLSDGDKIGGGCASIEAQSETAKKQIPTKSQQSKNDGYFQLN